MAPPPTAPVTPARPGPGRHTCPARPVPARWLRLPETAGGRCVGLRLGERARPFDRAFINATVPPHHEGCDRRGDGGAGQGDAPGDRASWRPQAAPRSGASAIGEGHASAGARPAICQSGAPTGLRGPARHGRIGRRPSGTSKPRRRSTHGSGRATARPIRARHRPPPAPYARLASVSLTPRELGVRCGKSARGRSPTRGRRNIQRPSPTAEGSHAERGGAAVIGQQREQGG